MVANPLAATVVTVILRCDFPRDPKFRVPQKEFGKRSSITFFVWDSFGHFLVTSFDVSVTFFVIFLPNLFCRTPFASG